MRAVCDKVRLIAKVGGDHCWITTAVFKAGVPVDQSFPVVNPRRFGIRTRIPKTVGFRAVAGFRAVIVQNYPQTERACRADDFVHYLQRIQSLQIGINCAAAVRIRNVGRNGRAFDHLVGVWKANRVVAGVLYGIQNRMVIPRPEAVDDLVLSFETIPIDSRDANHPAARIDNLIAAGVPVPGTLGKGRGRYSRSEEWEKKNPSPTLAKE